MTDIALVMSKGPDAFRTISEVADDLDIPQHVLRFWETRFTTIRPLKRGGGRRYYRPDDVDLLKGIRQLLYGQGYTIKGVQRILKEDGPRFVQGIGRGDEAVASAPPDSGEASDPGQLDDARKSAHWSDAEAVAEREWSTPPASLAAPGVSTSLAGPIDDLAALRSALDELLECQRVLETLRRN